MCTDAHADGCTCITCMCTCALGTNLPCARAQARALLISAHGEVSATLGEDHPLVRQVTRPDLYCAELIYPTQADLRVG